MVFLQNSVFNGKIENKQILEYICSYAPTDTGNSIGSSLYIYFCIKKKKKKLIIRRYFPIFRKRNWFVLKQKINTKK